MTSGKWKRAWCLVGYLSEMDKIKHNIASGVGVESGSTTLALKEIVQMF